MSLISSLFPFQLTDLTSESLASILFTVPLAERRELPDDPGVYIVTVELPHTLPDSSQAKVLYVGMTAKSLRSRWQGHELLTPLNLYYVELGLKVNVSVIVFDLEEEDLEVIEMLLIKKLDPHLNYLHKPQKGYGIRTEIILDLERATTLRASLAKRFKRKNSESKAGVDIDTILELIDRPFEEMSYSEVLNIALLAGKQLKKRPNKRTMIQLLKADLGNHPLVQAQYESGSDWD